MIISCPSCLKKFKIEETLIPSKGRNLQCGSCNYNWFYKIENKTVEPLKLEEKIEEKIKDSDESVLFSSISETLNTKLDQELDKDVKNNDITHNSDLPKKSENITFGKFLSYIIVSIISFAVFVILIDTIKTPLIDIFPGLEILLFNLFETLQDIKLFIIDLS
jgi:predicted Zn finger-like uncharacterized protein